MPVFSGENAGSAQGIRRSAPSRRTLPDGGGPSPLPPRKGRDTFMGENPSRISGLEFRRRSFLNPSRVGDRENGNIHLDKSLFILHHNEKLIYGVCP